MISRWPAVADLSDLKGHLVRDLTSDIVVDDPLDRLYRRSEVLYTLGPIHFNIHLSLPSLLRLCLHLNYIVCHNASKSSTQITRTLIGPQIAHPAFHRLWAHVV